MRLTLVRHGETEENVQKTIQGQQPGHLTEHGKQQAEEAAQKLKGRSFDMIYCSDLQRCLDTAEFIRRELPGTPFTTDELLRERYGGGFEGKPLALLDEHKAIGDWYTYRLPDGGESWADVRLRQVPFLSKVFEAHPEWSILVISHRGPIRAFVHCLRGRPWRRLTPRICQTLVSGKKRWLSRFMDDNEEAPLPCADKLAFDTPEQARATATVSEHRYGGKLNVYKCQYCQLYHLSSS